MDEFRDQLRKAVENMPSVASAGVIEDEAGAPRDVIGVELTDGEMVFLQIQPA